jgi:hypothetical protein
VTWIDINAPYYPEFAAGAYRDHPYGRSPIDAGQVARLEQLSGLSLRGEGILQVNFTRPEQSPCLLRIAERGDPRYREALAILLAGKENLARRPRPDMPGFRSADPRELAQEAKYERLKASRGQTDRLQAK